MRTKAAVGISDSDTFKILYYLQKMSTNNVDNNPQKMSTNNDNVDVSHPLHAISDFKSLGKVKLIKLGRILIT